MTRLLRPALRLLPIVLAALAVALVADEALAQSTGGSFGGGSFGGGGGSSSSSGGGFDDDGDGVLSLVFWILLSRLPWPLKLGLIGLVGGGWVAFKIAKRRRSRHDDDDAS